MKFGQAAFRAVLLRHKET